MEKEHITGLMLGITTKDSILFSNGFGYADLETKRVVDDHTLFRMGSVTKMFVSLGILKLVSEGKLNLNDELKLIAPEIPFENRWEKSSPIRIIHLLEHTSGFDDFTFNRFYSLEEKENKGISMVDIQSNSMHSRWEPGERYAYSNPNYSILGYLIEKISGMAYDKYLTDNILQPLGMLNSNFNVFSKIPNEEVKEYIYKNGQTVPIRSVTLLSGPDGALWSSANDMLKFLQLLLRNGSPIFEQNTITDMETTHSSLASKRGQKNGYGPANDNTFFPNAKYPFRGHEGIMGACFTSCKYNRELSLGYIISSNSNCNNSQIEELIVSYFEKDLPTNPLDSQPLDIDKISPFLGRYQFDSPRFSISAFSDKLQNAPLIYLEDGKLYFKKLLGKKEELIQTAPNTFTWKGMNMDLIYFTKTEDGKRVMLIKGVYYEHTSNFYALIIRVLLSIALLFCLSSIFLGIISIIQLIRGKLPWRIALPRTLPMIGSSMLIWSFLILLDVQKYSYKLSELGSINFRTMAIFIGTSLFSILALTSLFYAIGQYKNRGKSLFVHYLLLIGISMCAIMIFLLQNEWIGLRTWSL